MRCLTYTHQRITLEVSWVPTATPENQIDLVSVHCALSNAGGPRRKGLQNQTPANNLMLQQCTFTPLYEVLCLFSEGGALRRLRGRQSGQSTESRAKKDRQINDEGIILVKAIKLPRTLPLNKNLLVIV